MPHWKNKAGRSFEIQAVPTWLREAIATKARSTMPPIPQYEIETINGIVKYDHTEASINSAVATEEAKVKWAEYQKQLQMIELKVSEQWFERTIKMGVIDREPPASFIDQLKGLDMFVDDDEAANTYLWGEICPSQSEREQLFEKIIKLAHYDEGGLEAILTMFQVVNHERRRILKDLASGKVGGVERTILHNGAEGDAPLAVVK